MAALVGFLLIIGLRPDLLTGIIFTITLVLALMVGGLRRQIRRLSNQHEKAESEKRLLIESIECAPLGFAVYAPDDRLLAWNKSYERFYPKAFEAFRGTPDAPPPRYADLVIESIPPEVSADKVNEFVAQRVEKQRAADGTPVDRHYPIAGWRRVTKYVTASGAIAGFAVDISALKEQEAALQAEIERRHEIEAELKVLASTDSLTGALNRRAFLQSIASEIDRCKRYKSVACLILLDIDWFKTVNDKYGHQTGDEALKTIVNIATANTRSTLDKVGRLGGEEFGLLLPQTTISGAQACAELLREPIASVAFKSSDGADVSITASFGISEIRDEESALTNLIGEADRAMYESKAQGRNRVTVFMQPATTS